MRRPLFLQREVRAADTALPPGSLRRDMVSSWQWPAFCRCVAAAVAATAAAWAPEESAQALVHASCMLALLLDCISQLLHV